MECKYAALQTASLPLAVVPLPPSPQSYKVTKNSKKQKYIKRSFNIVKKRTSKTFKMEGLGVNVDDQEGHNVTTHVE